MTDEEIVAGGIEAINFFLESIVDDDTRAHVLSSIDYCLHCGGKKYDGRCWCPEGRLT